MTEKTFQIGLLGTGFMGRRHLEAFNTLPGVDVHTRTSARFAHLEDREDLYRAMIEDPELDAIDICLPTGLHAPLTIAALDAGKHVICEKPMALTVEDCGRMLEAKNRNKGVLMVAHVLRFWPAYRVLHEAVVRGGLMVLFARRGFVADQVCLAGVRGCCGRRRVGARRSICWSTITIRRCGFSERPRVRPRARWGPPT